MVHVVLDAEGSALRARIRADQVDPGAEQWRLDHVGSYEAARSWMAASANLVIDTTLLSAMSAASLILALLQSRHLHNEAGNSETT